MMRDRHLRQIILGWLVAVALCGLAPSLAVAPPGSNVPLCAGLTIVTAISRPGRDFRSQIIWGWLVAVALCALAPSLAVAPPGSTVPLCAGLTIVTAISQPAGDY